MRPGPLKKHSAPRNADKGGHSMKKRILGIFAALVLCLMMPTAVMAAGTQPENGDGSAENPYRITESSELLWFITQYSSSPQDYGKICGILENDIEIESSATFPASGAVYNGTFDGNGHTVSGLEIGKVPGFSSSSVGFIGYLGSNGVVKDLTVRGNITSDEEEACVGGIVGFNLGTVKNCRSEVNVTATGNASSVGGVVGYNWGKLIDCSNSGKVTGTGASSSYANDPFGTGGIAGYNLNTPNGIQNCFNSGKVTDDDQYLIHAVGGIAGMNAGVLKNCYYLAAAAETGIGNDTADGTAIEKTEAQFRSGEVALLLQNDRETLVWGQTLTGANRDEYPVLTGDSAKKVYISAPCPSSYSNGEALSTPHELRYTGTDAEISCKCSNCSESQGTAALTLDEKADRTYTGSAIEPCTVTYSADWVGGNLTIDYTDNINAGTATAAVTKNSAEAKLNFTIEKAAQNGPAAPEAKSKTTNSVTLNTVTAAGYGEVRYACSTTDTAPANPSAWQTSPLFTGLNENTAYFFFARYDGDSNHKAAVSGGAEIRTLAVCTVTLDANGGTVEPASVFTDEKGHVTALPTPVLDEGIFMDWYTEAEGGAPITDETFFDKDTTIYAHWKIKTYAPIVNQPAEGGKVTVSPSEPSADTTVTVTVTPEDLYEIDEILVTDADGASVEVTDKGGNIYTFTQPKGSVTVNVVLRKIITIVFEDVPADAYYYEAVYWAVEKGITNGTSDTTFSPESPCTRAQALTFLWRAAGCPAPRSNEMPFTDVAAGSYYRDAILWAVEKGITNGTSDTTFSPESPCTRAQALTFLWRYQGSPVVEGDDPFTDVEPGSYYENAVLWAVEKGITNGTSDTAFSPELLCTRAQDVTFLRRALADGQIR